MSSTKYLVIFYGVSAGQNGPNLGSDEQDLVMLIFLVIDTEENKVKDTLSTLFLLMLLSGESGADLLDFFTYILHIFQGKLFFFSSYGKI